MSLNIDALKTKEERKKAYIESWDRFVKENPDMPLRENYRGRMEQFRIDKDAWTRTKTFLGDYVLARVANLIESGRHDLAKLYRYPSWMLKQEAQ